MAYITKASYSLQVMLFKLFGKNKAVVEIGLNAAHSLASGLILYGDILHHIIGDTGSQVIGRYAFFGCKIRFKQFIHTVSQSSLPNQILINFPCRISRCDKTVLSIDLLRFLQYGLGIIHAQFVVILEQSRNNSRHFCVGIGIQGRSLDVTQSRRRCRRYYSIVLQIVTLVAQGKFGRNAYVVSQYDIRIKAGTDLLHTGITHQSLVVSVVHKNGVHSHFVTPGGSQRITLTYGVAVNKILPGGVIVILFVVKESGIIVEKLHFVQSCRVVVGMIL